MYLPHLAAFVGLLAIPPHFEIHKAVQVIRNIIHLQRNHYEFLKDPTATTFCIKVAYCSACSICRRANSFKTVCGNTCKLQDSHSQQ
jgi:hypothetical protein